VTAGVTQSRRSRFYGARVIAEVVDSERVSTPLHSAVSLFDGFEFKCRGRRIELPMAEQRVIAFLAVHDRPVLRAHVAGTLWPDKTDARSLANLRSVLWRLRQPEIQLVQSAGSHLEIADGVDVDVRKLVRLATDELSGLRTASHANASELLAGGDLLPGWYEDWVGVERERLRLLRQHAMETTCGRLTAAGDHAGAVDVGLAAVSCDPLRESAHRALILAHLAEGNVAEAIRQYTTFRVLLWKALRVKPGRDLQALIAGCLDPGVPTAMHTGGPRALPREGPRSRGLPGRARHPSNAGPQTEPTTSSA
jgi:DNA-binding SARP family transcriptional activator